MKTFQDYLDVKQALKEKWVYSNFVASTVWFFCLFPSCCFGKAMVISENITYKMTAIYSYLGTMCMYTEGEVLGGVLGGRRGCQLMPLHVQRCLCCCTSLHT